MIRRRFLTLTLAATALIAASGHTPYRQWAVYRQKHLLVLTLKGDGSYPMGKAVAEYLLAQLPASAARVARAPHQDRVASLLATRQLEVALLDPALATQLASTGDNPLGEPIPLTRLVDIGDYWLVAHGEFHPNHAYQVVATLATAPLAVTSASPVDSPLAIHPGALAFQRGEAVPEPPVAVPVDDDHDHGHNH